MDARHHVVITGRNAMHPEAITVAGVAKKLGWYGISNDLSESYNRLAIWRITQSGHFTKTEQRAWAGRQGQLL